MSDHENDMWVLLLVGVPVQMTDVQLKTILSAILLIIIMPTAVTAYVKSAVNKPDWKPNTAS